MDLEGILMQAALAPTFAESQRALLKGLIAQRQEVELELNINSAAGDLNAWQPQVASRKQELDGQIAQMQAALTRLGGGQSEPKESQINTEGEQHG